MDHIVDGHNLVEHIAGLSLSMPDDEQRLIELLVQYCKLGRHRIEVYFDAAPVGQAGVRNFGRVHAHFVSQASSADEAIRRRLARLGRAAKNWMVVTSDRSVQASAHEAHAQVINAEGFSRRLQAALQASPEARTVDEPLSEAEVREWEAIFKGQRKGKEP